MRTILLDETDWAALVEMLDTRCTCMEIDKRNSKNWRFAEALGKKLWHLRRVLTAVQGARQIGAPTDRDQQTNLLKPLANNS